MPCTEKLSEQLSVADSSTRVTTTSGSTTITSTAIDGINYNRLISYSVFDVAKSATGISWSVKWQAAPSSTMTATAITTVKTCSGTVSDTAVSAAAVTTAFSCEVSGEEVQSQRVTEDRYVRAVVNAVVASAHAIGVDQLVLADSKRYHPS